MCSMASVESIAGQVVADYIYCDNRDWDWDLFPTASGLQEASGADSAIDAGRLALGVR